MELGFNYLNHQNAPAEAVAVLQEACAIEPTAQYLSFLAQAQVAAGDRSAAEATLRKAVDADKTYGRAYTLLISLLGGAGQDCRRRRNAARRLTPKESPWSLRSRPRDHRVDETEPRKEGAANEDRQDQAGGRCHTAG